MSYIKIKLDNTETIYGYFLGKEEGYVRFVNVLCANWALFHEKPQWLEEMQVYHVAENLIDYNFLYSDIKENAPLWIVEFPILEEDIKRLNFIAQFFSEFLENKEVPICRRLEELIEKAKWYMPKDTLSRIIKHIVKHNEDDSERLRLMLSSKIQVFL